MILAASWASAARAPSCAASPPRPASRSLLRLFPESFDFIFAPCKICRLEELLHLKCFGLRGRRAGCGHAAGRPALGERSPEKNDELFEQAVGPPRVGLVQLLELRQRMEQKFRIDPRVQCCELRFREL